MVKLAVLLVLVCLASIVQAAEAGSGVTPEQIAYILGDKNTPASSLSDRTGTVDKQLDMLAKSQTTGLARSDPQWNTTHPKWATVYARVRADLADDIVPALAEVDAGKSDMQKGFEGDVAAQMQQPDVSEIVAYYETSEGKRYQAFMQRIDLVFVSGAASLIGQDASQTRKPTDEEMKKYLKVLQLSRPFESISAKMEADAAAKKDTSGYAVTYFMAGAAIRGHLDELEKLDQEFKEDLSGFEAFNQSGPMKHFFLAMGIASTKMANAPNPVTSALQASIQKHSSDWKASYQAATTP